MAKIDLQGDEFVVMEMGNFIVKSIPLDVILTTRRLILIDNRKNAIPQRNIPLTTINNIELGENIEKESTVTLSIITKSGEIRPILLTLQRLAGSECKSEFDEWVMKLKEYTVSATAKAQMNNSVPIPQFTPVKFGAGVEVGTGISPKSQVGGVQSSAPDNFTCPTLAKVPKRLSFTTIAAIILVIVVIIGVVIVIGQITKGKTEPVQNMVATSITPVATTYSTPVPTSASAIKATAGLTPTTVIRPHYIIPSTGTWVRILYPGNFVGYVGTRGFIIQVNNTVEQFIQLPASTGIISGSIGKQDGTSDNLTVAIYKDGTLVFSKNTRKPLDIIDFQYTL